MSRPELQGPPQLIYNETEALKYTKNTRIAKIQAQLGQRTIELLELDENTGPKLILDLGCGSGLSGEIIDMHGHMWVGLDISNAMLDIAKQRCSKGDLVLSDLGEGVPFRPGTFDAAISVSALQWLCNADKKVDLPMQRLKRFFSTLFACLKRGAKAVFQFYPLNDDQIHMITQSALKAGFSGGLVVDNSECKKLRKYFLCLSCGFGEFKIQTENNLENTEGVKYSKNIIPEKHKKGSKNSRALVRDRSYILNKKEIAKLKGKEVPNDSKYTGRKRKPKF